MEMFEMVAPCLLGVEGLVGEELRDMEAAEVRPENGRVFFKGDEHMLARANMGSRYSERILIHLGTFPARTFEELFQGVKSLPWAKQLSRFLVRGNRPPAPDSVFDYERSGQPDAGCLRRRPA